MSARVTVELKDAETGEWVEVVRAMTADLFLGGARLDALTFVMDVAGNDHKGVAVHGQGAFPSRQLGRKFSRATRDMRAADMRLSIEGYGRIVGKFTRGRLDFHAENGGEQDAFHLELNSAGRLNYAAV